MKKPELGFWQIWNMSFGFFGIQIAFALQNANVSRIFQTLGADINQVAILWIAGPVTGLIVQPLIGHFSDRTWTRLGRRRPYFLVGAILTTLALFVMPNSPVLWVAALTLWILDASINVSMEPFRAFVGDLLPSRQRASGFAMQSVFIGSGAFLASLAPGFLSEYLGVSNTAPPGVIPDSVKYSFYIGAAAVFFAILWTVLTTREYAPADMTAYDAEEARTAPARAAPPVEAKGPAFFVRWGMTIMAVGALGVAAVAALDGDKQFFILGGGAMFLGACFLAQAALKSRGPADSFFSHILDDLTTMPVVMRQLAVVQFFSWFGLFVMWIYSTPAVTSHHYGTTDPTSALYNEGANWVGVMFAVYNLVAAIYAFLLPPLALRMRRRALHAINLVVGGIGLVSYFFVTEPMGLLFSMACIGIAWASILTMPYTMLSDALPPQKMGVYMGIFNFFIVLPQIIAAGVMGPVIKQFLGGEPIYGLILGGLSLGLGAVAVLFVNRTRPDPEPSASAAAA